MLVVERDDLAREALRSLLADCGYVVHTARDEAAALDVLARLPDPPCVTVRGIVWPIRVDVLIETIERYCGPAILPTDTPHG